METLACTTLFALHKVSATGRETCLFLMINTLTGTHKTCELCTHTLHTHTHMHALWSFIAVAWQRVYVSCASRALSSGAMTAAADHYWRRRGGREGGLQRSRNNNKKSEAENTTLGQIRVLMMLTLHRDRNNLCLLDSVNVKTTNNLSK